MQFYKPLALGILLLGGCAWSRPTPVTLRFHEQVSEALPDGRTRTIEVPGTGKQVTVDPYPQISEHDVFDAKLEATPGGSAIRLRFDAHGANTLSEMTTRMRGRYVVIFQNEKPIAFVLIEKIISNGEFLLETDLSDDEQAQLVTGLNKIAGRSRDFGETRYQP